MSDGRESDVPPIPSKYFWVWLGVALAATLITSEGVKYLQIPRNWAFVAGIPFTFVLVYWLRWVKEWYAAGRKVEKYNVE